MKGKGWFNESRRHGLSAKGIKNAVKDNPSARVKVLNSKKKIAMKEIADKFETAKEVEDYLIKFGNEFGLDSAEQDRMFTIDMDSKNRVDEFEVRTDGLYYKTLYDPSSSDLPILRREAEEEFGVPHTKIDPYKYQNELRAILRKRGWSIEPDEAGIIRVFKDN